VVNIDRFHCISQGRDARLSSYLIMKSISKVSHPSAVRTNPCDLFLCRITL
jgi:hypothetical protein